MCINSVLYYLVTYYVNIASHESRNHMKVNCIDLSLIRFHVRAIKYGYLTPLPSQKMDVRGCLKNSRPSIDWIF